MGLMWKKSTLLWRLIQTSKRQLYFYISTFNNIKLHKQNSLIHIHEDKTELKIIRNIATLLQIQNIIWHVKITWCFENYEWGQVTYIPTDWLTDLLHTFSNSLTLLLYLIIAYSLSNTEPLTVLLYLQTLSYSQSFLSSAKFTSSFLNITKHKQTD